MERRKFVVGLGSLAAGGAAAMGTGAFTSQTASRNLTISTAEDPSAYVGLKKLDTPNSQAYISMSGDELIIDVGHNSNGGEGINVDGHTRLDDLFGIDNQGTQTAYVYIRLINSDGKKKAYLYDSDDQEKALSPDYGDPGPYTDYPDEDDTLLPDPDNIKYSARKLSPGERLRVGLDVEEVYDDIFQQNDNMLVMATTDASQVEDFPPNTHD